MLDKTLLNLSTILITGAGIFAVFTKFNVPELGMTFFDRNPFIIKRTAIDSAMTWIFTMLALFGLVIQAFKEVFGDEIADRLHNHKTYLLFFLLGLLAMIWALWLLSSCGKWIAKRSWMPDIVRMQQDAFNSVVFIVEHDGWREEQLQTKDSLPNTEQFRKVNFDTVEQRLVQIEKRLELPAGKGSAIDRIEKLKPYFGRVP